jgi:hypothetical protein
VVAACSLPSLPHAVERMGSELGWFVLASRRNLLLVGVGYVGSTRDHLIFRSTQGYVACDPYGLP